MFLLLIRFRIYVKSANIYFESCWWEFFYCFVLWEFLSWLLDLEHLHSSSWMVYLSFKDWMWWSCIFHLIWILYIYLLCSSYFLKSSTKFISNILPYPLVLHSSPSLPSLQQPTGLHIPSNHHLLHSHNRQPHIPQPTHWSSLQSQDHLPLTAHNNS